MFKKLIELIAGKQLFRNRDKCRVCIYLKSVSNHSPCYECKCNDMFELNESKEV